MKRGEKLLFACIPAGLLGMCAALVLRFAFGFPFQGALVQSVYCGGLLLFLAGLLGRCGRNIRMRKESRNHENTAEKNNDRHDDA